MEQRSGFLRLAQLWLLVAPLFCAVLLFFRPAFMPSWSSEYNQNLLTSPHPSLWIYLVANSLLAAVIALVWFLANNRGWRLGATAAGIYCSLVGLVLGFIYGILFGLVSYVERSFGGPGESPSAGANLVFGYLMLLYVTQLAAAFTGFVRQKQYGSPGLPRG